MWAIYPCTYDWPTDSDILSNKSLKVYIYFDSNTQKDLNEPFSYNNSTLSWIETLIFMYKLNIHY